MQFGETNFTPRISVPAFPVRNEQGTPIGAYQPGLDEHGNALFRATSVHTEDELVTRTKSAATFWVGLRDDIARSQINR